jgi:DNA-binding beta-propeller fold protein YncE
VYDENGFCLLRHSGTPFFFPFCVRCAACPGHSLFICSVGTDSVLQFDGPTGGLIGTFVPAGSGGLNNPGGLAFGPDGNLYVSSRGTNNVLRYNGATGAFLDVFVPAGSGGLAQPVDLTFGPDSHFYVSNFGVSPTLSCAITVTPERSSISLPSNLPSIRRDTWNLPMGFSGPVEKPIEFGASMRRPVPSLINRNPIIREGWP